MERRNALKTMAGALGGLISLPAWANGWSAEMVQATRQILSASQASQLAELVETIIPVTDTPGAKTLNVHQFVQKMVADCYDKATQENLQKGLDSLDGLAKASFNKPFAEGDTAQRTALLTQLSKSTDGAQKDFYSLVKNLTIRGYLTSEYVMTNLTHYQFIPGHYYGCVPVNPKPLLNQSRYTPNLQTVNEMSYLNIDAQALNTYDAIVIGSGISGGWAAKELTGKGLRTLVLERGRDVRHVTDYPTTNMQPWEFEHRNQLKREVKEANPIISRCYAFYEGTEQFFVKDAEHPYIQEKPFDWIRGYQVGGKSLMWARQTQRWSDFDFEGPARDGFAVDWPIRYADIAPWYSYVEKFAGISGNKDGLATLPDGEFLPPHEWNCVEKHFQKKVAGKYNDRHVIMGRAAHITQPQPIHFQQGRAQCQHRTICERGCPFGGYFSSNSSTIPWAAKTGKMTLRPNSVVHSIIYDEKKGRATGVRVVDANTKQMTEYYARIIFLNAAALNSNLVLLNSTSHRFPNGLGNDSGVLGKYAAFHNYRAGVSAEYDGDLESTTDGRRPNSPYIPRFRNVHKQETNFLRGYAAGFSAGRGSQSDQSGVGADLKESLLNPKLGGWYVGSHMMGETIPKESNYLALDASKKDPFGIPQLKISIAYDDNDDRMVKDYQEQLTEMFTEAGFTNIRVRDSHASPGLDIHEMGGVRMGKDPKTSMLNKWNQLHAVKNVFVTDGSCMTSTSTQNPSLTYMALAARAADYAVKAMKKGLV